jgi:hypothetical protein
LRPENLFLAIAQSNKAITIAIEMKKNGIPSSQIAKYTKLSIEEIEKL